MNESRVLSLETTPDNLISEEFDLRSAGQNLFILDYNQKRMFRFASDGQFLNTIGKPGKGPDELHSPSGFYVDTSQEKVEFLNEPESTVKKYDFGGAYHSKVAFDFPSRKFIKRGDNYYFYRGLNSGASKFRLTFVESSGETTEMLEDQGNPSVGYVSDAQVFGSNGDIVYLKEALLSRIIGLKNEGIVRTYLLDTGKNKISEKELKNYSGLMAFFSEINARGFYTIKNFVTKNGRFLMKVQYQQENEDLKNYFVFYDTQNGKAIKTIIDNNGILAKASLHEYLEGDTLLFSINALDWIKLNKSTGIPSKPFKTINENDNPILLKVPLSLSE